MTNNKIKSYRRSSNRKIDTSYLIKVGPLSKIGWTQNYPYNIQMPIDQVWDGRSVYTGNIDVGCANIGVATLFSIVKPSMVGVTASGRQILIDGII